jgi:hypothetical protein
VPDVAPDSHFRQLDSRERAIFDALLAQPFPGREELAFQLRQATARRIDNEGSLGLKVIGAPPAQVTSRVPVEAQTHDSDGMDVFILLHVVDGFAAELDVFRGDSQPRPTEIDATTLRVSVRDVLGDGPSRGIRRR